MGTYNEDVEAGRARLDGWIRARFRNADIDYLGRVGRTQVHRWNIDFLPGKQVLHLGATEPHLLDDPALLQQRLFEFDDGTECPLHMLPAAWATNNPSCSARAHFKSTLFSEDDSRG